jgi:hypothetical protein
MSLSRCTDIRRFTDEERQIIETCDTPEKAQAFIDAIPYNFESDGVARLRSFRRVVRDRLAHCFEGALTVATILSHHGYPPRILCMEAREDFDHMIFPYRRERKLGAVAQSRDPNLKGRPPVYATVRDLVMSYYPQYKNLKGDLALRGYCVVDLRTIAEDWMTMEHDVWPAEDLMYEARYRALFPRNGCEEFLSNRDESITWIQPKDRLTHPATNSSSHPSQTE